MKRINNWFWIFAITIGLSAGAAGLPSDWQHEQSFAVSTTGLIKISLPVTTLDAARPALEDLRLYDDAGNEIPFVIEHPKPSPKIIRPAKSFQVSLNASNTVITLETGLSQPLDAVVLESPAMDFIKAVQIESSADGQNWQLLAQGRAVFRQPSGATGLKVTFPPTATDWLRLTVDDRRSSPVPFTGARIEAYPNGTEPNELIPAVISERDENPGETRLALNLGAANLDIAAVKIETGEPLFTRQVELAVPQISEDAIREQTIGRGMVYRVAVEGQTPAENLSVPLEKQVRSRELILFIKNGDSPPLPVSSVQIERRPVYLAFLARQAGTFYLLTGNPRCNAPHYDLAALNMNLKSVAVPTVTLPPLSDNPDYHAPEVLPGIAENSTALDVSGWKFREPLKISRDGVQEVELDVDALAHAQPDLADLRVMRGSNQVPYVLEHTSIRRAITPIVTVTNQTQTPAFSRWTIRLPRPDLPITGLVCTAQTSLFQRDMTLFELVTGERGETYRRMLTTYNTTWTQTPDRKSKEFNLALNGHLQTDTMFLETQNGDNPPIRLEKFMVFYPATRLLFKAKAGDELYLYYGNPRVAPPRYDLSLVANQLLAADKISVSPASEQQLRKPSWRENEVPGKGGVLFWGMLAVVVVALLVIISRLLPKSPAST